MKNTNVFQKILDEPNCKPNKILSTHILFGLRLGSSKAANFTTDQ